MPPSCTSPEGQPTVLDQWGGPAEHNGHPREAFATMLGGDMLNTKKKKKFRQLPLDNLLQ